MENQNLKDKENVNSEINEEALLYSEPIQESQFNNNELSEVRENESAEISMDYARVADNSLTEDEEVNEQDNDGFDMESLNNIKDPL
jgi:uncharacterized LabA/DUF88 family protein